MKKKIDIAKSFAKTIHIDLLDGRFADNTTFLDPEPFRKYSNDVFFELHMMVLEPMNYLDAWGKAGIKRFLGHIEHMSSQVEFLEKGKLYGEAGLAIDGPTPITSITVPLSSLERILFMGIKAGFSGQVFQEEYLNKIKEARDKGFAGTAEVDGGINFETIMLCKNAGATRFVSTSHLFNSPNVEKEFKNLTSKLNILNT